MQTNKYFQIYGDTYVHIINLSNIGWGKKFPPLIPPNDTLFDANSVVL
jgi:hypothetical protein